MAERGHQKSHEGSKARREELAMRKRKSPTKGHVEQEERPVRR